MIVNIIKKFRINISTNFDVLKCKKIYILVTFTGKRFKIKLIELLLPNPRKITKQNGETVKNFGLFKILCQTIKRKCLEKLTALPIPFHWAKRILKKIFVKCANMEKTVIKKIPCTVRSKIIESS